MARNRKRAKERRARRPQGAPVGAPRGLDDDAAPDPIEHASPDVELAEAQLALGRPELPQPEDAAADEEELEIEAAQERRAGRGGGPPEPFDGRGRAPRRTPAAAWSRLCREAGVSCNGYSGRTAGR